MERRQVELSTETENLTLTRRHCGRVAETKAKVRPDQVRRTVEDNEDICYFSMYATSSKRFHHYGDGGSQRDGRMLPSSTVALFLLARARTWTARNVQKVLLPWARYSLGCGPLSLAGYPVFPGLGSLFFVAIPFRC